MARNDTNDDHFLLNSRSRLFFRHHVFCIRGWPSLLYLWRQIVAKNRRHVVGINIRLFTPTDQLSFFISRVAGGAPVRVKGKLTSHCTPDDCDEDPANHPHLFDPPLLSRSLLPCTPLTYFFRAAGTGAAPFGSFPFSVSPMKQYFCAGGALICCFCRCSCLSCTHAVWKPLGRFRAGGGAKVGDCGCVASEEWAPLRPFFHRGFWGGDWADGRGELA